MMSDLSIFLTEFGWCGLLGTDGSVERLVIGHTSSDKVRAAMDARHIPDRDWFPELRKRLQRYARGEQTDFDDVPIKLRESTKFRERVIRATRRIGYGETVTYGQLATHAGAPRAARAVGNVMAANRFPIIVPCHRVVAAAGKLGGFSAPQGVSLKQLLLGLEATTIANERSHPRQASRS